MRLLELVESDGEGVNVSFHPELTVIAGLDARARRRFVDRLDRATAAVGRDTELRYIDQLGRHLVVTRVGGRRRIMATDASGAGYQRIPLPPPDDLPRTTRIDARTLSAGAATLTVPQRLDLMVSWLNRARHQGPGGHATVAVLDEPFTGLPAPAVHTMLDAVERLARTVQIILLTADAVVTAWARKRADDNQLAVVAGTLVSP